MVELSLLMITMEYVASLIAHPGPPMEVEWSFTGMWKITSHFQLFRTGIFPSFSPDGKHLICNDKTAGILHNSILVMNSDGTEPKVLFTHPEKSALAPVWSLQGDKIAFAFGGFFQTVKGKATADIAVMDSQGKGLVILTDSSGNYGFPSWSPDGKKIVYRASSDSIKGLFIVDINTRKVKPLTINSQDNFPAWSPNGNVIAFTSKRDGDYEIYSIKPDGTDLRRLTNSPGNDAHCTWSPDGQWIAFSSGREGFKDESALHPLNPQPYGEICVIRADGSDFRMLTDNQYEEATPGWLPLKK
jgi:TolB protein